jgi:hypothetical protein
MCVCVRRPSPEPRDDDMTNWPFLSPSHERHHHTSWAWHDTSVLSAWGNSLVLAASPMKLPRPPGTGAPRSLYDPLCHIATPHDHIALVDCGFHCETTAIALDDYHRRKGVVRQEGRKA